MQISSGQNHCSRRAFFQTAVLCAGTVSLPAWASQLSNTQDTFLEELERTTFEYFLHCSEPSTGLVKDRHHTNGDDSRPIASIAATGFGLSALCIAHRRGWIKREEARQRVGICLNFLAHRLSHEHGFFYHFVHWQTGEREWKCELSSIDTAILVAGVLTCRSYFRDDPQVRALASEIYERIDWSWMLNGGKTLSMGWKPESGFLARRWDKYCELMMLYLLAIGSPKHPIPKDCWDAWQRPSVQYRGLRFLSDGAPLFVHQFSHAWFDFQGKRDQYADYFENSIIATRAHRQFCFDLRSEFPAYDLDAWGITSSDSAKGYVGWGGPPRNGPIDGTLVPCAAAGSLPFLPRQTVACLKTLRSKYQRQCWTRFGFCDAFNPLTGWTGSDVVGIDAGITILMAENLRTGFVWRQFMHNPEANRAMRTVGFHSDSVRTPRASTQP